MNALYKSSLCVFLSLNLIACGTILHPERKGQQDGQLDTSIVALNAVGLLLYLVPGVIAFAVDFSNGTIYLPGGDSSSLTDEEMADVYAGLDVNIEGLSHHFDELTQARLSTYDGEISVTEVDNVAELAEHFRFYAQEPLASL